MSIDRQLVFKRFFEFPGWPCSRCERGQLSASDDKIKVEEPQWSKAIHDMDYWEPEMIETRFHASMTCTNSLCGEICVVAGKSGVEQVPDEHFQSWDYLKWYEPIAFVPAPKLIQLDENCPQNVFDDISSAFALFWADQNACANRLRAAAEAVLTDRKVARFPRSGKRSPIPFGRRIDHFAQSHPELKDFFAALQWLGNAGSHAGSSVSREDLITAFEMFEHIISRLYGNTDQALRKRAKEIKRRRGKPKRRPHPRIR